MTRSSQFSCHLRSSSTFNASSHWFASHRSHLFPNYSSNQNLFSHFLLHQFEMHRTRGYLLDTLILDFLSFLDFLVDFIVEITCFIAISVLILLLIKKCFN